MWAGATAFEGLSVFEKARNAGQTGLWEFSDLKSGRVALHVRLRSSSAVCLQRYNLALRELRISYVSTPESTET